MISKNKQTSDAAKQSSKNKQTSKLSENAHFKSLLKAGFGVTAALILYQLYKRKTHPGLLNTEDSQSGILNTEDSQSGLLNTEDSQSGLLNLYEVGEDSPPGGWCESCRVVEPRGRFCYNNDTGCSNPVLRFKDAAAKRRFEKKNTKPKNISSMNKSHVATLGSAKKKTHRNENTGPPDVSFSYVNTPPGGWCQGCQVVEPRSRFCQGKRGTCTAEVWPFKNEAEKIRCQKLFK
jgi:hypothetical protein